MKKKLIFFGVLMLTATAMSAQTVIGYWPFSGNANDESGNGLNGTVYNATLSTDQNGTANEAYYFNGTDAHIDVPYSSLLNLSSWTIRALVDVEGFNSATCHAEFIVSRGTEFTGNTFGLFLTDNDLYDGSCTKYNPDSTVFEAEAAGTTSSISWSTPNFIQLDHWYCVTAIYANDTMGLYLDGVLINSGRWSNDYDYGTSTPVLSFGYYNEGGSSYPYYFNGKIEDLTIWSGVVDTTNENIATLCTVSEGIRRTTGVPQISNDETVTISPNPAVNILNVQLPDNANATLYVINEIGQTVLTYTATKAANVIDVNKLPAGLYVLKTAFENGNVQTNRFVKD